MSFDNYFYKFSKLLFIFLLLTTKLFSFGACAAAPMVALFNTSRIYFSTEYIKDQAPFIAVIFNHNKYESQFCSGVLIAQDLVLTVASCISKVTDMENIQVYLYELSIQLNISPVHNVSNIYIHPDFKEINARKFVDFIGASDLAVLKLKERIKLAVNMSKLSIENKPWPDGIEKYSRTTCLAIGYGKTEKDILSLYGNRVSAEQGPKACACLNLTNEQKDSVVCLNNLGNERLCHGETGGPLVCDGKLVAIAHYRAVCANYKDDPNELLEVDDKERTVDTYIYIYPYLGWVNSLIIHSLGSTTNEEDTDTDDTRAFQTTREPLRRSAALTSSATNLISNCSIHVVLLLQTLLFLSKIL